ncbi:RYamide neuropeptides-like isoform X2 [Sitodiplosis mosellana]|uniref:RYamide neuropeptides-like isoform X2 n=1 Tax=Sitodiplosis mosellana TaxID=263140 RepID=UPI002444F7FA|nr:RYamide neuropeptides-like isoform X2 [Sitodiplosis mosellana]
MVFVNSVGFVAITVILCTTMCNGKNMYDDIDTSGPEGLVEVKRPAFYAGSRYGRSNGGQSASLRITPRRDFHFLRYGKRSDHDDNISPPIQCYEPIRDYVLTCSFTGVRDFYRCWKGQENKFDAVDQITLNAEDKTNQQQLI